jgi:hypothetical protein
VRGKAAPGLALTPALSREREREKTLPTDYLTDVLGALQLTWPLVASMVDDVETHEETRMSKVMAVVAREMREAVPALLFFLVVFHMLAITKAVILEDYHITTTGTAVATVGALIVAKAILVVEKLPIARLFSGRMLYNILWKALLFSAVSLLFRVVEELLPLLAKHNGLISAATHLLEEVSWPHFWVLQMWLYASLLLYCLAAELVRLIGPVTVKGMLLGAKASAS